MYSLSLFSKVFVASLVFTVWKYYFDILQSVTAVIFSFYFENRNSSNQAVSDQKLTQLPRSEISQSDLTCPPVWRFPKPVWHNIHLVILRCTISGSFWNQHHIGRPYFTIIAREDPNRKIGSFWIWSWNMIIDSNENSKLEQFIWRILY